tara:strand:- start:613 stop:912 length:300 start_codon:yes stop_codon:yes gene_type:complete
MSAKISAVDMLIPLYITGDVFSGMLYMDYMKGQLYNMDLTKIDEELNEAVLDYVRNQQFPGFSGEVPQDDLDAAMKIVDEAERPTEAEFPSMEDEDGEY